MQYEQCTLALRDTGDPSPGVNRDARYRLKVFLKDALRTYGSRAAWTPTVPENVPRMGDTGDGDAAG